MVAVDLTEDLKDILHPIRTMDFLKESEFYLVHCSMSVSYNFVVDFGITTYPIAEDRSLIQEAVVAKISGMKEKILPYEHGGTVHIHCLFGENQSKVFCDFALEHKVDLIVVAPRLKHGIFESSFAKYVSAHSKANVLLLKPH